MATLHTVLGPIDAQDFGFALPHEHVLCDFIGAAETSPERWDRDEVTRVILPLLLQLRERGVTGFVDCTPAWIGRDVELLRRLSLESGLHVVTNTGYYGAANDRFLPAHAHTESVEQLTERWVREWEDGIERTGVRPGFIKIGVDRAQGEPARLSDVDAKIVRAAAHAQQRTGLAVASHTAQGAAALAQIDIFEAEGADPGRLIIVHADAEPDPETHFAMAERGAWVEYDGIGWRPVEEHLTLLPPMIERYPDRLLLSMDSGWYWAGEPGGGKIRDYNALTDGLLPRLREQGIAEDTIRRLTVENPARAFARVE